MFYLNRSIIMQRVNMNKIITFIILFIIITPSLSVENLDILINTSTYTSIDEKECITLDSDNSGSVQECESFQDIGVKVIEGDIRQSIILTRNEKEYDLAFYSTVSPAFSSLGLKIEWRHEQGNSKNLRGIIVRFEASDDYENEDKVSSYLVVSKITNNEICVVARVSPQKRQNEIARSILDAKKALPCLKNFSNLEK
ncbi:MAG: Unknown protein [uncultured Sulfurovum sp.]|uniref:Uncharacterized protein n=1 Tax=uncultured Sulfurovum sp. TaxID=269237 RepID=A0A6S6SZF7_9BACT|nr:MAG: Unknown protein [uncultured Sulfurovum sp.]